MNQAYKLLRASTNFKYLVKSFFKITNLLRSCSQLEYVHKKIRLEGQISRFLN